MKHIYWYSLFISFRYTWVQIQSTSWYCMNRHLTQHHNGTVFMRKPFKFTVRIRIIKVQIKEIIFLLCCWNWSLTHSKFINAHQKLMMSPVNHVLIICKLVLATTFGWPVKEMWRIPVSTPLSKMSYLDSFDTNANTQNKVYTVSVQ